MTLKSAAQKAIGRNPEVLARYHAYRAAEGELESVAGALLPHVDVIASVGQRRRSEPAFSGSFREESVSLQVTQLLWDGLSSYKQKRQFAHARLVRLFEFVDASETAALEAGRAYYDVLRFRALVALAEENYIQHRSVLEQIGSRVKAGVGRRVDLEQATGRMALSESNLLVESANLHDVSARFQRIVGEPPARELDSTRFRRILGEARAELESPSALSAEKPKSVADALRVASGLNPQVRAAVENVRAAAMARDARRGAYDPRIQFRFKEDRGRDLNGFAGATRNSTAEVLLNFNIFNGFSDRGRVTQAEGLLDAARDQRDKACRDTRQTLAIALNDVRKLAEQRDHLELHRASVEKARDAYRQQFEIGQRSLLDLLDTENELFQARRAKVNATMDLDTAHVRVHAGIGRLLPALGLAPLETTALGETGNWDAGGEAPEQCPPEAVPVYSSNKAQLDGRAAELTRSRARTLSDVLTARAAAKPGVILKDGDVATLKPPAPSQPGSVAPALPATPAAAEREVAEALRAWTAAWASRDIAAYLAFYAPEFEPADGASRAAWEAARKRALGRAAEVRLALSNERFTAGGSSQVTAEFRQNYASATYRDEVDKTLVWKNAGGRWLIVDHHSSAVPAPPAPPK